MVDAVQHFSAVIDEAIGWRPRADQVNPKVATMTAARPVPEPAVASPLRAFYEHAGTTVSSGPDRAQRQARMLAAVLAGRSGPQRIVDVGCGKGSATHVIKRLDPRNTVIGIDWSAMALAPRAPRASW